MRAILLKCLAVSFIVGAVIVGCSKQDSSSSGTDKTVPEAAATSGNEQAKRNACDLVDSQEIEAIAGTPLTAMHDIQAEDQTACEFYDQGRTLQVIVTVHWKGGKELARAQQAGLSMAKQLLNTDDVDIEELTGSGKVRGLADKAYYSDIMPSWVLKGDVMIEVSSPLYNAEKTKKVFMAVAKKALSRLPS